MKVLINTLTLKVHTQLIAFKSILNEISLLQPVTKFFTIEQKGSEFDI